MQGNSEVDLHTTADWDKYVLKSSVPVIVDFHADWYFCNLKLLGALHAKSSSPFSTMVLLHPTVSGSSPKSMSTKLISTTFQANMPY